MPSIRDLAKIQNDAREKLMGLYASKIEKVAETQFEIDTLSRCKRDLPVMMTWVAIEEGSYHGSPDKGATIQISMQPEEKKL